MPDYSLVKGAPASHSAGLTIHRKCTDMKCTGWATIFAISIAIAVPATAADFGGVTLGSSVSARSLEKLGILSLDENVSAGVHRGKTKFEYVDANSEVTIDSAGHVAAMQIDFYTQYAPSILEMALKKWGKPVDSGREFFDGHLFEVWIWKTRDGASITLNSYDPHFDTGSLTRGSLVMITQAAADAAMGTKGNAL